MNYVRTFIIALLGIIGIFGLAIPVGNNNFWFAGILFLMVLLGVRSLMGEISNQGENFFLFAIGITVGLAMLSILLF